MKRLPRLLNGIIAYVVWPSLAAAWAFGETDLIFRERRIPLPFEAFGALVAASVFCFAMAASILVVGLWKKRRVKSREPQKNAVPDGGRVELDASGVRR